MQKEPHLAAGADKAPVRGAELTAYARLEQMFDAGSFVELDAQVHHRARHFGMEARSLPGDGIVTGFGTIAGRTAYAYSQDRSVLGGSLGEAHAQKMIKVLDMAGRCGAPIIGINDSGGARIQEGVEALAGYGEIFRRNVRYSGVVPQISMIMGPCAGGAVYSPALTDFVIMVAKKSYMFVTGPKVVRTVTGEQTSTEELGGGDVHASTSGVAHFLVRSELEGLELTRRILSYLPSNNMEGAPRAQQLDVTRHDEQALGKLVPKEPSRPYEMAKVIAEVVDRDSFLEVRAHWGKSVVCGFARLGGQAIGIVGNNPAVLAGVLDIDASRKAARFVRTCDAFGLPIVSLVDVPGFLPGKAQEHGGIIDHGAKLAYAFCEATVPKLTVILRKAYGGAYIVMGSKHVGADMNFAWPAAEIAVMGAAGATEILHAKEIQKAQDPVSHAQTLTDAYRERFAHPGIAASRGYIDAVIAPDETRQALCRALTALSTKREARPGRRHGNVPL